MVIIEREHRSDIYHICSLASIGLLLELKNIQDAIYDHLESLSTKSPTDIQVKYLMTMMKVPSFDKLCKEPLQEDYEINKKMLDRTTEKFMLFENMLTDVFKK